MTLLLDTLRSELETLVKNDIRLQAIGDITAIPGRTRKVLEDVIEETSNNKSLDLILALNYSGRWDIMQAMRSFGQDVKEGKIDPSTLSDEGLSSYLSTAPYPDPELLIRTSGEHRLSNFLLWETAYTEFYFTDTLWPDFGKEELMKAIIDYQQRDRRFGGVSVDKVQ